jgi:uncharacterized protein
MRYSMNEFVRDVFILPASKAGSYIIYSPLRGMSFWANKKAANVLRNYFENGIEIPKIYPKLCSHAEEINRTALQMPMNRNLNANSNKAVFILSQKCNLACSYCYAKTTRSQNTINSEKIKTVADYILFNKSKETKRFSFIGGGEPTLDWDLFAWAVNYIKNNNQNQKLHLGLTTNATLLNEQKIEWLKNNDIHVGVSFDILPEIQNKQRPFNGKSKNSFEIVDKNFKMLVKNKLATRIRSTITSDSVASMPEMVQFTASNYPEIKKLHFEPVTDPKHITKDFYSKYIEYFFASMDYGKTKGIEVYNSITNSVYKIQSKFCGGEFCVTPKGEIVTCHRVSSEEDEMFKNFYYGKISGIVEIEDKDLENASNVSNAKTSQCENCFAKWH